MRILCTFPGRTGDVLWSLPTARMISRHFGVSVDFAVSKKYGDVGLVKLLRNQEYINDVFVLPLWEVLETAPMSPRVPPVIPDDYTHVFHLGYSGWPKGELAHSIYAEACAEYAELHELPAVLGMEPWIQVKKFGGTNIPRIFIGWSEEWIELKMGVTAAVTWKIFHPMYYLSYREGMRHEEFPVDNVFSIVGDLCDAAKTMASCDFYLGCLSSQWVLANAMGKRCVVMEPAKDRHNKVFWRESEKNTMVLGGDGLPTFDARHVVDAVKEAMRKCGF